MKRISCFVELATAFVDQSTEEQVQKLLADKLALMDRRLALKGKYQWTQDWQLVVRYHPTIDDEEGYPKEVMTDRWRYVFEREYAE